MDKVDLFIPDVPAIYKEAFSDLAETSKKWYGHFDQDEAVLEMVNQNARALSGNLQQVIEVYDFIKTENLKWMLIYDPGRFAGYSSYKNIIYTTPVVSAGSNLFDFKLVVVRTLDLAKLFVMLGPKVVVSEAESNEGSLSGKERVDAAIAFIQEVKNVQNIPVLVVTGSGPEGLLIKLRLLVVGDCVLLKPFSDETINAILEKLV